MERAAGILLPVFSLPSSGGVGTLGRAAYDFVDFLAAAGQRYWQTLPLGPTGFGDSPYQSFSAYAGNPYFVDLDLLAEEGLLTRGELCAHTPSGSPAFVDYEWLAQTRLPLLRLAFSRGRGRDAAEYARFCEENAAWLPDYALFMALKFHFGMRPWTAWPDEGIRRREPAALERYSGLLAEDIAFFSYIQFQFFRQWRNLRAYAHERGILIMGDMPIYVAFDSADVWARPDCFLLDENLNPVAVAGVPPDYFSASGQLWGNPLYRWDDMEKDGFAWWRARAAGAARLYDALRIDHFRGFAGYWRVPSEEATAINGSWEKGPGMALVRALKEAAPELTFIAEDLGCLDDAARALVEASGFPNMKVLEFAFDPAELSTHLPHAHTENCVCYLGTHDNPPVLAWREEAAPEAVAFAEEYLGLNEAEGFHMGMLRAGMTSAAGLFIAQMQDYLALGKDSRVNTPGTLGNNWRWRLLPGQCDARLAKRIRRMTYMYGRTDKP